MEPVWRSGRRLSVLVDHDLGLRKGWGYRRTDDGDAAPKKDPRPRSLGRNVL